MKKYIKLTLLALLVLALFVTMFATLTGCGDDSNDACNSENCNHHPEGEASCHCHGNCDNEGCDCHTGH